MSPSYYLQAAQLEKMGAWDLVSWAFGREHLNLDNTPPDFKSLFRHFQFQDDILPTCHLTPQQRILPHRCLQAGRRFHLEVRRHCKESY